jgi:hypothetical protein
MEQPKVAQGGVDGTRTGRANVIHSVSYEHVPGTGSLAPTSPAVRSTAPSPASADDAIKLAIKAAVDAGQHERAAKLLEALRGT